MATCTEASLQSETLGRLNPAEMLHNAVSLVLKDDVFKLPTLMSKKAVETAEKVLEWNSESAGSKQACEDFSYNIVSMLNGCFEDVTDIAKFQKQREKMWYQYHQIRSSTSFIECWTNFLELSSCEAAPVFYQYVTDSLMDQLIKLRYPIASNPASEEELHLTYEEQSAVRYAAGYTVRSLLKKAKRAKCKQKQDIMKCLEEIIEEEIMSEHESVKWTKAVDRGKLIHVNDILFSFFSEMELVLRNSLRQNSRDLSQVVELIVNDEKVLFAWAIASVNWQEDSANILLNMFAEHWVSMRGHSHAKALMEKYKQKSKKQVQKSKGLRKQLQAQNSKDK